MPTAMVVQNSIGSESDFEELVSVTSSIEPLDITMPASPMDQRLSSLSLSAESSDDRSKSPADEEYPHHEKFYFDDGSVTFVVRSVHSFVSLFGELTCAMQVDGTAYCLHRFLFNLHSDTFSKAFLAGRKDVKSPIFLQDVEKSQFDAFLNVLYRTCVPWCSFSFNVYSMFTKFRSLAPTLPAQR